MIAYLKMKYSIALFSILISSCLVAHAQGKPDDIIGRWERDVKDGRMEIFKSGSHYYGKLLWGANVVEADNVTSKKDIKNPDPTLRTRNVLGSIYLSGLTFEDGEYTGGKIYDPTSGKTYPCKMWIENGKLLLRGYVGFSLFGKTVVWERF